MSTNRGTYRLVDKMTLETDLIERALAAARNHGLTARVTAREPRQNAELQADAVIELGHGAKQTRFLVEAKRAVTPATIGPIAHHLARLGAEALLITHHVTPPLAEYLRREKIGFLDTAGNAFIDRPPLFVWVKGQKPEGTKVPMETGRAFQPTGLQVLFALLCNPQAVNRPYRELAKMAGTAHGTVGWVMADLQQQGFVRDVAGKRGTRRLYNTERLLPQWIEAYARMLRPRTLIKRYYVPRIDTWREWHPEKHGGLWGGEPAAALMTEYLRPGELTVYAEKLPGLLAAQRQFKQTPEPGNTAIVDVRRKFWDLPGDPQYPNVVPPLLVYADLLATGEARCLETAQMLYKTHVARLYEPI